MKSSQYRILWKGQITGPFDRETIEGMLSRNEIGVWAEISDNNSDWKPISEWRIREPAFKAAPKIQKPEPEATHHPKLRIDTQPTGAPDLPPLPHESATHSNPMSNDPGLSNEVFSNDTPASGGFFYWALMPIRKYGVFTGRARRKEYWLYTLLTALVYGAIGFAEGYLEYGPPSEQAMLEYVYMVDAAFFLILLVPNLAVTVRRLHDTNRSGWWVLIGLTGIGLLVLLLFAVQEGTEGENEYGLDPK
jgi:uncharacterized membrane protein YhaH (DUF805 family)